MGVSAAQRAKQRGDILPGVLDSLSEYADDAELFDKVERAIKAGWTGAVPVAERMDAAIDPPTLPDRWTVVAADGSQIYPDRHGVALYYVINVGSIVIRLGTGETPIAEAAPIVCFDDEQLYDEDEFPISGQTINARRTVAEMTRLAQLAIAEVGRTPESTLALADGNLALRVKQESIPRNERDRLERDYIHRLNELRAAGVVVGGFISRPGATSIVRLMQLAQECPPDEVASFVKNNKTRPFGGITDTPVFALHLKPGQRSAVFKQATQWGVPYEKARHAIHFFYLNIGNPARIAIARIEVPEWIASAPEKLGLLHAALVDQCHLTGIPYPYALIRADELAVITNAEKAGFEQMIAVEMMRNGVDAGPSEKAATKSMARYGKRK